MEYKTLLCEKKEGIGLITINRPKVLNALNSEVYSELGHLINEFSQDREVKVIIITGSGEKAFAAGADIVEMKEKSPAEARGWARKNGETLDKIESLDKPVIAAINGFALGGGCELAMACDLRIASENARFGQLEINLGIIPGSGGTQRLSRLIGIAKAKELVFTGEMISAKEALEIGLINKVVSSSSLMEEAKKMAKKMVNKGAIALAQAKSAINRSIDADLATGLAYEIECFAHCFATEDQKEGFSAFLEKRQPKFSGK